MIQLMIADDHILVREAIKQYLKIQPDIRITGEAASGPELISKLKADPLPDLLMTDLNMPGMCGIELVRQIREAFPHLPVLVLSSECCQTTVSAVLNAGAASYILKNSSPETILDSVRRTYTSIKCLAHDFPYYLDVALRRQTSSPRLEISL